VSDEVVHKEIEAVPVKVVKDCSEAETEPEIDEVTLMKEKNRENLFYLLKMLPKAFTNPKEARRAKNYASRQAKQLIHRTIEVVNQ